jgi:hypothetical protein
MGTMRDVPPGNGASPFHVADLGGWHVETKVKSAKPGARAKIFTKKFVDIYEIFR